MTRNSVLRSPREHDAGVLEAMYALFGNIALLVAHDLRLFDRLRHPQTLAELQAALGIRERPAEVLLSAVAAQGFVTNREGLFSLTPLAEDYLLEDSPTYAGAMLDLALTTVNRSTAQDLKQAVLSDVPPAYGSGSAFESHERQAELATVFARAMHGISMAPALAWPRLIDLSEHAVMLDVGGGSGAHSIGAVTHWPRLQAVILDLPAICKLAQGYIGQYGCEDSIHTRTADMWSDPFPAADVHLYSQIFHDWPPGKCAFLTQKSFAALPPGGKIIVHEILYNDDKCGPLLPAIFSVAMLLWTEGRHYSGLEIRQLLEEAGFIGIEQKLTFGLWSIVTGHKP